MLPEFWNKADIISKSLGNEMSTRISFSYPKHVTPYAKVLLTKKRQALFYRKKQTCKCFLKEKALHTQPEIKIHEIRKSNKNACVPRANLMASSNLEQAWYTFHDIGTSLRLIVSLSVQLKSNLKLPQAREERTFRETVEGDGYQN